MIVDMHGREVGGQPLFQHDGTRQEVRRESIPRSAEAANSAEWAITRALKSLFKKASEKASKSSPMDLLNSSDRSISAVFDLARSQNLSQEQLHEGAKHLDAFEESRSNCKELPMSFVSERTDRLNKASKTLSIKDIYCNIEYFSGVVSKEMAAALEPKMQIADYHIVYRLAQIELSRCSKMNLNRLRNLIRLNPAVVTLISQSSLEVRHALALKIRSSTDSESAYALELLDPIAKPRFQTRRFIEFFDRFLAIRDLDALLALRDLNPSKLTTKQIDSVLAQNDKQLADRVLQNDVLTHSQLTRKAALK